MDRLKSMQAFVMAVEGGTFAAAAQKLGISPQMVAKYIAALEEQTGLRLIHRTTRRHHLTEFGALYYQRSREILRQVAAADLLAQQLHEEPRGSLRISAPIIFGHYSLMPLINQFMRDYPGIEFDIELTDKVVDVIGEGFDAVFRIGELADSSLVARALPDYQLLVCASPAYLAGHGIPEVPQDLTHHQCLGYVFQDRGFETQWHFTREGKAYYVPVSGKLRVNESQALMAAALEGAGIVLGSEMMFRNALAEGKLLRVLPHYVAPSRPAHLVYPADKQRTTKLTFFIAAAMAYFSAPEFNGRVISSAG